MKCKTSVAVTLHSNGLSNGEEEAARHESPLPRAATRGLFVLGYSVASMRGRWSARLTAGARDHLVWPLMKILLAWVALFLL